MTDSGQYSYLMGLLAKADLDDAQREVARAYIEKVAKLSNGSKGDPDAISDVLTTMTPILLHLYFSRSLTNEQVEQRLAEHARLCHEKRGGTTPINWRRLAYDVAKTSPLAVAVITICYTLIVYRGFFEAFIQR